MINKHQPQNDPHVPKKNHFSVGSLKFRPLKLSTYEKSSSRTEMPNKYRSVDAPRVNIEDVYEKNLQDKVDSSDEDETNEHQPLTLPTQVSFPIRSFRDLKEATSFRDSTQTKPFYYVENNEIMSVDQFFNVYKDMTVYQNKKHRASHRKDLKEKEKLIGDVSTPKVRSFPHSISVSPNLNTQIFDTQGSNFASPKNLQLPSHRYKHNDTLPTFLTQRFTFHPNISSPKYRDKSSDTLKNAKVTQATQTQINSPKTSNLLKDLKSKSPDQKFTEKHLQKQLQWTFMSPKLIRQNTADIHKEKAYQAMFKDPKTLDLQIENNIRKAQKIFLKQTSTDFPQRQKSVQFEKIFDELHLNQSFTESEDQNKQSPNGSVDSHNKDERVKKVNLVSQKIEKNIRHISKMLRSNSPTSKMKALKTIVTPVPSAVSLKPKNKFPLRMDVAQKYNLGAKLKDHKTSTNQVRKTALALQKEAKSSEMKSQTYVSYYN